MCDQIERTGSAIPAVRLVFDLLEHVFDGAKKFLAQGAVDIEEGVDIQLCCVVRIVDGRCFVSGRVALVVKWGCADVPTFLDMGIPRAPLMLLLVDEDFCPWRGHGSLVVVKHHI